MFIYKCVGVDAAIYVAVNQHKKITEVGESSSHCAICRVMFIGALQVRNVPTHTIFKSCKKRIFFDKFSLVKYNLYNPMVMEGCSIMVLVGMCLVENSGSSSDFFSLINDEYNIISSSLFSSLFGSLLYLIAHCEPSEMLRVFLGVFWIFFSYTSVNVNILLYCHYFCPLFLDLC